MDTLKCQLDGIKGIIIDIDSYIPNNYFGPTGLCFVNEAKVQALWVCHMEVLRLGLQ